MDGPPWAFGENGLAGIGSGHKLDTMDPLDGWALGMDGPQWALRLDKSWEGIALGMDGPPWAHRMDVPWEWMRPRDGWVSMGPRDGWALRKGGPPA